MYRVTMPGRARCALGCRIDSVRFSRRCGIDANKQDNCGGIQANPASASLQVCIAFVADQFNIAGEFHRGWPIISTSCFDTATELSPPQRPLSFSGRGMKR